MKLSQILNDGEAKAQSALAAGGRSVSLAKSIEHVREKIGCDALAGIFHADFDVGIHPLQDHVHPT